MYLLVNIINVDLF